MLSGPDGETCACSSICSPPEPSLADAVLRMTSPEAASAGATPSAPYDLFEATAYQGIERLRAGGMGEVWHVEHRKTRRKLLAKVIHPKLASDPRLVERMRLEAAAQGAVRSEYTARILDFSQTRTGRPFIVMEFVEGRTLGDELAATGPLHMIEATTFAMQILSALAVMHQLGLVHRDIKPDNLMVCVRRDGSRYIKLLDFGVVRVMPGSEAVQPLPRDYRTRTGVVVGTPRYVSPEGAMGRHVDQRADLYAVGLVLYTMLVGRGPFDHLEHEHAVLTAHALDDPEPPSRHSQNPIPPELDRALMKALAKDPGERFQTAEEFKQFLERVTEAMRRPAGWLETTTYEVPAGLDAIAPPNAAKAEPPTVNMVPTPAVSERDVSIDEPALIPLETWRVSTTTACAIAAVMFALAGLAAFGLVSLLRGAP